MSPYYYSENINSYYKKGTLPNNRNSWQSGNFIDGDFYKSDIKQVMVDQITSSVQFYQMIEKLIADGVDTFIELGPKTTLCSFVKKISRDITVMNVENIQSLESTLLKLEE